MSLSFFVCLLLLENARMCVSVRDDPNRILNSDIQRILEVVCFAGLRGDLQSLQLDLQLTHTRAVVRSAGLVQVLLEHLNVQVGARFHLQFDGEVVDHILDD